MVELHFVRTYAAPRQLVWDVWTDPDQMAQWWGPRGVSTPRESIELDLRPGGVVKFDMVDDANGTRYANSGRFLDVEPPIAADFTETIRAASEVGWGTQLDKLVDFLAGTQA